MDSGYGDYLWEKADTAMYEDEDDDRVGGKAFDPDTRSEAAARLAEIGG